MKDLSYFQLRAFLYPRERRLTATFKISELENVWHCTSKNVKRKLKKFEEEGQLIYRPGSGRGNPSVVIYKNSFQQEVEREVHRSIQDDQLENIMHLLQLPIPKLWVAKASKDVQLLFGFHSPSETKDVLRTMISREITTLDPLYCSVSFESHIIHQLGDSLVMYKPEEDAVVPHIAHHWKADDTYRVWTFYLRKGVLFHHHRTLTSEDVKFTFERFKTASSPYHWFVQDLSHIECPSPFIVRFHLREPNPFFLRVVSSINLAILPKDSPFDPHHWIGTGPYKLKNGMIRNWFWRPLIIIFWGGLIWMKSKSGVSRKKPSGGLRIRQRGKNGTCLRQRANRYKKNMWKTDSAFLPLTLTGPPLSETGCSARRSFISSI